MNRRDKLKTLRALHERREKLANAHLRAMRDQHQELQAQLQMEQDQLVGAEEGWNSILHQVSETTETVASKPETVIRMRTELEHANLLIAKGRVMVDMAKTATDEMENVVAQAQSKSIAVQKKKQKYETLIDKFDADDRAINERVTEAVNEEYAVNSWLRL